MSAGLLFQSAFAWAGWNYSGPPGSPNAFIQTGNTTLALHCDRIRFAPAGYEDSQDIVGKQGLVCETPARVTASRQQTRGDDCR